jgi:cellulose synthase/poly-beta-1,6-N-acetylglucosamine synthase-like glycosyltransferase
VLGFPDAVAGVVVALGIVALVVAARSLLASALYLGYARRAGPPAGGVPDSELDDVTLVVPCCGDEDGLEANLEALVGQRYPGFDVRFVVAHADDRAVAVVERVRARHAGRAQLVVAGRSDGRGQKVHNLLAALDASPLAPVVAFADSDGRPEPDWLRRLVAELRRPGVGVASSYRFYRPLPPSAGTLLRSVWNLSILTLLGEHEHNFAWGGSIAITRGVFEQAGVREAWRGALSDDYALTHAVRRAGLRVAFVPECLVGSDGAISVGAALAWTARQISITRVYWSGLFRLAAASSLCSTGFLFLAAAVGGALPLGLLALVLALGCAGGGLRAAAVARLAPRWRDDVRRFFWAYVLLSPLAGLVTTAGVLRALASRRIEWRGTRYEMRSPHETLVLGR